MRLFTVYRRAVQPGTERWDAVAYNQPEDAQVQGVVFDDGKLACRWLTVHRSTVVWDSYADFHAIHIGTHPDYGTEVVWHDGFPAPS